MRRIFALAAIIAALVSVSARAADIGPISGPLTFNGTVFTYTAGVIGMVGSGAITLNAGAGTGLTAPGAMSLGGTYTFGATTDTPRFAGLGLGGPAIGANELSIYGGTSGRLILAVPAAAGTNTLTLPAGTTDLSSTGPGVLQQSGAGAAITVGTVANSLLANSATTVNGQSCALGGSCTITASAGTITVGTTTIASGTTKGLLYDNAGVLGNLATANSGLLVTDGSGNPSISTAIPAGVTATTQATTDNSTKVATTAYVTSAVTASNPAVAVQAATTQASDTSGYTYSNGVGGVGATLTGPTNTALTVDGFTFTTLGQRILVKNDTQSPSGAFNGVYGVTQLQAIGLGVVLTRATDYDQPSDINNTGSVPVVNGTVNGGSSWLLTSTVNTVGTDPLTYTRFSYPALTLTNGQLAIGSTGNNPVAASITAGTNITVTPGAGSLTVGETNSSTTVNGQTCTLGSSCTITATAGTITVGTTSIASGGTGGVLYETGGNLLGESAALTSGQAVVGGGAGSAPHVLNAGANTGTYFGASGVLSNTGTNYADGKVLIGTTGGNPTIAALTAGTGIGVTNGPGSITINLSTPVSPANGGTGINNGTNTLTLNAAATSLPAAPGSTQCLHMSSAGAVTTTGADCGSAAAQPFNSAMASTTAMSAYGGL